MAPTSVVALLNNHTAYREFRRIVREIFPDAEAEILNAHDSAGRETARVWAFLKKVEREFFPTYDVDVRFVLSKLVVA